MVKVKALGHLRSALKGAQVDVDGGVSDIRGLLNKLSTQLPADEQPITSENTLVLVNGVEISALAEYDTPVTAEDEIVLIPVVHGG